MPRGETCEPGVRAVRARGAVAVAALALAGGLLGLAAVSRAALPPDRQVNQQEVCLVCHDLDEALAAPVKHSPVQTGDCTACHNPHVSRFDGLLRKRPATLCIACHSDLERALEQPVVHEPVADGRCVDCHEPHGGDHAGLLVRSSRELCRGCHEDVAQWEKRPVKHPPFAKGDCSNCHDPHAADHPGLAAKPGGGICSSCHPVTDAFRQSHRGYPVERAQCGQCHDPHASEQDGLFRTHLHSPFEDGDCTTCHSAARREPAVRAGGRRGRTLRRVPRGAGGRVADRLLPSRVGRRRALHGLPQPAFRRRLQPAQGRGTRALSGLPRSRRGQVGPGRAIRDARGGVGLLDLPRASRRGGTAVAQGGTGGTLRRVPHSRARDPAPPRGGHP